MFFLKMRKVSYSFQKRNKNFRKRYRFLKIMAFEHVAGISLNYDENTCDRQSTYCQRILRFQISRTEMFSDSINLGLIEIYDESDAV